MLIEPIWLGQYHDKEVFFDLETALNMHMGFVGDSGTGKSTMMQKIIMQLGQQEQTEIILDLHSSLDESQVFEQHSGEIGKHLHVVDAYKEGISCDLFSPLIFSDGEEERAVDTVSSLADILSRSMRLGVKQQATLRRALHYVAETGGYEKEGLRAVDDALEKITTAVAETVRERLYPLTGRNIFRPGQLFIETGKINIIRLSKFDLESQVMIAEIILAYIWRLAQNFQFKDKRLFVFVDEFQNLPSGKGCTLGKILAEGRKFGVNLILATQQLSLQISSELQNRLMQSGLVLLFRPNKLQTGAMARLVNPVAPDDWTLVLRTLGRGEFIAMGPLLVDGRLTEKPLRVSAFEKENLESVESEEEEPHGRGTVRLR